MTCGPPRATLFPYTTLFRSQSRTADRGDLVWAGAASAGRRRVAGEERQLPGRVCDVAEKATAGKPPPHRDRKSTRLNSSHRCISYAVFCLKKKKNDSEVAPD